jgi:hypothetical protein
MTNATLASTLRRVVGSAALIGNPLGAARAQSTAIPADTLYIQVNGVVGRVGPLSVGNAATPNLDIRYQLVRPRGSPISYDLRPISGHSVLYVVWGETLAVTPRGSGVLNGSAVFEAAADRVIRIQNENRRLYQLHRDLLTTRDPLAVYVEMACEIRRLVHQYPDSLSERLVKEAAYLATDPVRDALALRRVDDALAGHVFSTDCEENRRALKRRPTTPFP